MVMKEENIPVHQRKKFFTIKAQTEKDVLRKSSSINKYIVKKVPLTRKQFHKVY